MGDGISIGRGKAERAPRPRRVRAGLTIIEVLVTIACVIVAVTIVAALWPPRYIRTPAGGLKCSTQVRGVVQSMIVWAGDNKGKYPLPSELDVVNATVPEPGRAKDTTANILSVLIFNGNISPEITISPAESNTASIERMDDYALTNPPSAVSPSNALWDPNFNADFTDPKRKGNVSYAHLLPAGPRLKRWADTFSATEAVMGNRGPRVAAIAPLKHDRSSNTLLIHGGKSTWEGNIGYNDGHVNFETKLAPDVLTYRRAIGFSRTIGPQVVRTKAAPDVLFADEADDALGANVYLSIFKTAGETKQGYQAVWD